MPKRRTASISLSYDVLAWLIGRGLSQADVARMLGVSEGYISLVKSGGGALSLDLLSAPGAALKWRRGPLLLQVAPPPARMTPETAELFDVTERLIRKADQAAAAIRGHMTVASTKKG